MQNITINIATTQTDIKAVKTLFLEYIDFIEAYLGRSLAFQKTDAEFKSFPAFYDRLYLARLDGVPAAACGIKPFRGPICELKRLYCRPEARGYGVGKALIKLCLDDAKNRQYTEIYLDTDHGLVHANAIYESMGFKDIDRYYDSPIDSRFMAKKL